MPPAPHWHTMTLRGLSPIIGGRSCMNTFSNSVSSTPNITRTRLCTITEKMDHSKKKLCIHLVVQPPQLERECVLRPTWQEKQGRPVLNSEPTRYMRNCQQEMLTVYGLMCVVELFAFTRLRTASVPVTSQDTARRPLTSPCRRSARRLPPRRKQGQ